MIRDGLAFTLLIIGFLMVWTATPGHAAELAPVHPSATASWLYAIAWIVGVYAWLVFFRRAHVEGDE